jgi:hypothetical protein
MDWLEQELKRALARKDPAPGFAAGVLAARRKPLPARRWLAAAASVVVIAGGGAAYRRHQGIQAKEQIMMAVRLAADKLNRVQSRLMEVGQ